MGNKSKGLENLRGGEAATPAFTDVASDAPKPDVWFIYEGRLGPTQGFAHQGNCVVMKTGSEPLVFHPGLNIETAATWADYKDHKPFADRVGSSITVLPGHTLTAAQMRELSKVSTSPDALEAMLAMETDKPVSGAPNARRDASIVDRLTKRLKRFAGARVLDLHDVDRSANTAAAMAAAVVKKTA